MPKNKYLYMTLNVVRRVNRDDFLRKREADKRGEHMPFSFLVTTPLSEETKEMECHIYNASIGTPKGFPAMLIFEGFLCGSEVKEPVRGWVVLDTDPDTDGVRTREDGDLKNMGFETLGMIQLRIDPVVAMKDLLNMTESAMEILKRTVGKKDGKDSKGHMMN